MEGRRFDALARALAGSSQSRRGFLARAGAFAAAVTSAGSIRQVAAETPAKQVDLVAMLLQPSDPVLGSKPWVFINSWFGDYPHIGAVPLSLGDAIKTNGGLLSIASSSIATLGKDKKPSAFISSYMLQCKDAPTAKSIFDAYKTETSRALLPFEKTMLDDPDAVIGIWTKPDDPMFLAEMPKSPAMLTFYREDDVLAGAVISGGDQTFAASIGNRLIQSAKRQSDVGFGLAGQLAFGETGAPVVAWYSRLNGKEQPFYSTSADQLAQMKTTEGDATDFARATQFIPTTDEHALYEVTTWAARLKDRSSAKKWLLGTEARLRAQTPGVNLVKINEADGLGDASVGFLYVLQQNGVTGLGVDLYVQTGGNILAAGLNVTGSNAPGIAELMSDPRPLGAGAQAIIKAQLSPTTAFPIGPRPVLLSDIFGGSPLQPSATVENAGTTSSTTFSACSPSAPGCNKPAKQDQTTPYQVWCQPNTACTDAKCSCNLFRTKKKSTSAEWYGKQNEKKEYDPDNYSYSCSCGTVASS